MDLAGTLEVDWYDGFVAAVGDSFDILDWGQLSGSFDAIVLPQLSDSQLYWETDDLYTTGEISVRASSSVPLPGSVWLRMAGLLPLWGRYRGNSWTAARAG